jgi:hypothetical protein
MRELLPLTEEQLARAEERLRNPRPGSKIEAAQRYGVDLTLLIENLRLTPAERAKRMEDAADAVGRLRGAARRSRR